MDISNMSLEMIPQLSTALSTVKVQNQVNAELMSMALDSFEQSGAAEVDMMRKALELSVNPYAGSNIDISL